MISVLTIGSLYWSSSWWWDPHQPPINRETGIQQCTTVYRSWILDPGFVQNFNFYINAQLMLFRSARVTLFIDPGPPGKVLIPWCGSGLMISDNKNKKYTFYKWWTIYIRCMTYIHKVSFWTPKLKSFFWIFRQNFGREREKCEVWTPM